MIVPIHHKKMNSLNKKKADLIKEIEDSDRFVVVFVKNNNLSIEEFGADFNVNDAIAYHQRAVFHYCELMNPEI